MKVFFVTTKDGGFMDTAGGFTALGVEMCIEVGVSPSQICNFDRRLHQWQMFCTIARTENVHGEDFH